MEFSTISNDTMNITCSEDIRQEKEFKILTLQNEEFKQELHVMKKQLERNHQMKADLELEVDKLEAFIKIKTSQFETEKTELINTWIERVSNLQSILEEEREQARNEYSKLEKKFEDIRTTQAALVETSHTIPVEETLSNDKITQLEHELFEMKEETAHLESTQIQMTERINDMQKEIDSLKESLKCKSESLQEALSALEEMKDQKALISSELAILRAGPVENRGRGNSLFSELEDKRATLEKKLSTMHKKYLDMKKTLAMKVNELENTKRENMKFRLQWEEEEKSLKSTEDKLLYSYKQRIEELRHKVNKLELRPETPKILTISDKNLANMQWIHTIVDEARAEARDLRRALENKSMEKLIGEENMYMLKSEVTHLKRQAAKDKAVIEDQQLKLASLETMIEDLQLKLASIENKSEVTFLTEKQELAKKEAGKTIRFADDVKENDGIPLKKEPKKKEIQYPVVFVDTTNKTLKEVSSSN